MVEQRRNNAVGCSRKRKVGLIGEQNYCITGSTGQCLAKQLYKSVDHDNVLDLENIGSSEST